MAIDDLKKEGDRLAGLKGETKGSEIMSYVSYIRKKYGEDKIQLIEKKMEEICHPFAISQVKETGEWYSEGLGVLAFVTAKHLFNWTDKDCFDLGYNSPKYSFGSRVLIKYFLDPKKTFDQSQNYFSKFINVGVLEPYEFNKKKKYAILRLKDYDFHPLMCSYFAGFFLKIAESVIKSNKITIEETQCIYKGGPFHEYTIKWE